MVQLYLQKFPPAEVPKSLKGWVVSRFEREVYLRPDFNSLGDDCCLRKEGGGSCFYCQKYKMDSPVGI